MTDDLLRMFAELNPVAAPGRLIGVPPPDAPADPRLRAVLGITGTDDGDRPGPMLPSIVRDPRPAHTRRTTQEENPDMQATQARQNPGPTAPRRPRTFALGAGVAILLIVIAGPVLLDVAQRQTRVGFAAPSDVDVCAMLDRAERQVAPERSNAWEILPMPDTPWGARVCAVDVFDLESDCVLLDPEKACGFNYLHLLWYPRPTTFDEAAQLVAQPSYLLPAIAWEMAGPDRWTTGWMNHIGPTDLGSAVAVVEEPYFFVVTDADENKAREVADAIVELLDDPPTGND